jgi:hypothetical protein
LVVSGLAGTDASISANGINSISFDKMRLTCG